MPFAKLYFKTAACLYYRDGSSTEEFTGSGGWETRKHCAFKCRCPGESAVARFIADLQMKSHKCEWKKKREMGKKSSHVIWAHILCLKASGRIGGGETQSWSGLEKTQRGVNIVFIGPSRRVVMLARSRETYLSPLTSGDGKKANTSRWRAALRMKQRATVLQRHEVSVLLWAGWWNCSGLRPLAYRQWFIYFFLQKEKKKILYSCCQWLNQTVPN